MGKRRGAKTPHPRTFGERFEGWKRGLFVPVDASSLGIFRIVLGTMIAWDVLRYFAYGWVATYYIQPKWNFPYVFFEWLRPWPGPGMYLHFAAMGVCAVLVALGLYYRFAIIGLWLLYTHKFLLEQAVYMNHYYLIGLLCFLFIFLDAHHAYSLDRRRDPALPSTVPKYSIWILRFQLTLVYAFGAIAKLNVDWLSGEPMYSDYLKGGPHVPEIVSLFPPRLLAFAIAYGGIAIDAAVPVMLNFRRSRELGFMAALVFHVLNDLFLSIGVFSYLMIGAITIFYEPTWPRDLAAWWRSEQKRRKKRPPAATAAPPPLTSRQRTIFAAIAAYALWQLLFPLRHWVYPGTVSWTEEGHRFSWRMKLRDRSGDMRIVAVDSATGARIVLDPTQDLSERQLKKLLVTPDMVLLYAHKKAEELRASGVADPQIYVDWRCSVNHAPAKPLVDTRIDLTKEELTIWPARWILRD